ncbi:MAG: hypothetical protein ACI81R_000143 [Bradymonadia bacterium]|jgi:hypothetical protein
MSNAPTEARLYPRFKHTVLCRVEYLSEEAPQPLADLDIYSDAEDPRTALLAYIRDEFDVRDVTENKDGVLSVPDPAFQNDVIRHYQMKG